MPKKITLHSSKQIILIADTPFAHGGEAELYNIIAPKSHQNFVAKIYFEKKRTAKQEEKIKYLVANPPELTQQQGHQPVIWMEDSIYNAKGEFLGFIMPFAKGAKLEILCSNRIPKKYLNDWSRFSLKQKGARELRLKICFNLATAVYQIHKTQRYVFVDLKPDNILIQPNGLVSIVDMDSVQIVEKSQMLFPARVATPEFSPPEYYGDAKPGKTTIYETWDRFSLAVIFYKMLFGIHPYAGSSLPPHDKFVNLQDKIKHSLFVHSPSKKGTFKVIPPPHKNFNHLPVHIQNLFIRCFEYGHQNTYERPSANEWCWGTTPRQPLIPMRKLPSMTLPMKVVQYSEPISLISKGDDIQVPSLQTQPPKSQIALQGFNTKFYLPRITLAASIASTIGWLTYIPLDFNLFTFIQLSSIGATTIAVLVADYYSLPVTKEKHLILKFKQKISQDKKEKRSLVMDLIRKMQQIPKANVEVQKQFHLNQNQILGQERNEIDKIVGDFRHQVFQTDQSVLKLNQSELEQVQALEKRLLEGNNLSIVDGLKFLPLPEKVAWLEQKLENPTPKDAPELLAQLSNLKDKLAAANIIFEQQLKTITEEYNNKYETINDKAKLAHQEMIQKVQLVNQNIEQQKKALFEQVFAKQATHIEQQAEAIKQIKKEILELEDLYQNFNTAANKFLEYKEVTFKKYLNRIILRK